MLNENSTLQQEGANPTPSPSSLPSSPPLPESLALNDIRFNNKDLLILSLNNLFDEAGISIELVDNLDDESFQELQTLITIFREVLFDENGIQNPYATSLINQFSEYQLVLTNEGDSPTLTQIDENTVSINISNLSPENSTNLKKKLVQELLYSEANLDTDFHSVLNLILDIASDQILDPNSELTSEDITSLIIKAESSISFSYDISLNKEQIGSFIDRIESTANIDLNFKDDHIEYLSSERTEQTIENLKAEIINNIETELLEAQNKLSEINTLNNYEVPITVDYTKEDNSEYELTDYSQFLDTARSLNQAIQMAIETGNQEVLNIIFKDEISIRIAKDDGGEIIDNARGAWYNGSKTIKLSPSYLREPNQTLSTLIHELGHTLLNNELFLKTLGLDTTSRRNKMKTEEILLSYISSRKANEISQQSDPNNKLLNTPSLERSIEIVENGKNYKNIQDKIATKEQLLLMIAELEKVFNIELNFTPEEIELILNNPPKLSDLLEGLEEETLE